MTLEAVKVWFDDLAQVDFDEDEQRYYVFADGKAFYVYQDDLKVIMSNCEAKDYLELLETLRDSTLPPEIKAIALADAKADKSPQEFEDFMFDLSEFYYACRRYKAIDPKFLADV